MLEITSKSTRREDIKTKKVIDKDIEDRLMSALKGFSKGFGKGGATKTEEPKKKKAK